LAADRRVLANPSGGGFDHLSVSAPRGGALHDLQRRSDLPPGSAGEAG